MREFLVWFAMLTLSLSTLDWLAPSLQPLAWLADLLLVWLAASFYRSFDIGFVRVFSAVRISISWSKLIFFLPPTYEIETYPGGILLYWGRVLTHHPLQHIKLYTHYLVEERFPLLRCANYCVSPPPPVFEERCHALVLIYFTNKRPYIS